MKLTVEQPTNTDLTAISAEVDEVERHLHNYERWFGLALVPNAEIHVADRLGVGVLPFQIDAGNDTWGAWVQMLGSSDTPADVGKVKFDFHEIQMTGNERMSDYFIQFGFGASGAAALAALTYTEKVLTFDGINYERYFEVMSRRQNAATKVWARCLCPGQNTATLDFYIGIHEYDA